MKANLRYKQNNRNDDDIEKLQLEILELEAAPKTPLRLIATDCTPEATAAVMAANNGKIAILSDEGVFDVMAGLYTKEVCSVRR